jgi:carboxylesterase type B
MERQDREPEELFGDGQAALEELRAKANFREFKDSEGPSDLSSAVRMHVLVRRSVSAQVTVLRCTRGAYNVWAHASDAMHAAWVSFAKTGDPGWLAYDTTTRTTMVFAEDPAREDDPRREERLLWEGVR